MSHTLARTTFYETSWATMSHIAQIQTEVRSEPAVQAACKQLHLPPAKRGTFELYDSTETGLGIELPKWRYPVVANTETGQIPEPSTMAPIAVLAIFTNLKRRRREHS